MTDQNSDQHAPDPQRTETVNSEAAPIPTRVPERIGRYHIKRVIASGGMGTVYEATQDNPRRVVAVKVMKQGISSKSALRRFEYEGQILGRLRHPGIAQIFEAGTHDEGHGAVPYFAMEYIPNAKLITKYADEKKLGTRQRMELFAKVCDAIHHGHQKGIIHRDLKPGNILVDSHGEVKVIDFGVARGTDSDLAVTMQQTDIGQLIGTLQYMSPEQCEGDPHDIDTRSDVYALGMVFYQLLCGKLPYDVTRMAMHQATRAIREQHPTKLSTMNKTLRGDVETIALKALEKERERRYQSAADLGHDIQRYLTGEAILARRASIVYQVRLFARRNKAVFASLAAVFIVLVAGIIVSTSLYFRAEHARAGQARERERAEEGRALAEEQRNRAQEAEALAAAEAERAEKEAQTARQVTDFLVGLFDVSDPSKALGETITAREILDRGVKRIGDELEDQPLVQATLSDTMGRVYTSLGLYGPAEQLLREAVATRRHLLGAEHADVATTLHNLSGVLELKGFTGDPNLNEAEQAAREALTIRRRLFGDEHKDVSASLNQLATVLSDARKYAEAEECFRQALAINRKLFGEEDDETMDVLHDLARLFYFQSRYDEAEPLFREVYAWERKHWPDGHPDTAITLEHLSLVLMNKGQHEEAERLAREVLALRTKYLGDDHPQLAGSHNSLALFAELRGDFEEVERLARKSLSIYDAANVPSDHRARLSPKSLLGAVLAHRGQFVEAEPMLLEAYDGLKDPKSSKAAKRALERIVRMYDAWDAAEPGKGYAEKAAEWRAKLDETQKNQNAKPE